MLAKGLSICIQAAQPRSYAAITTPEFFATYYRWQDAHNTACVALIARKNPAQPANSIFCVQASLEKQKPAVRLALAAGLHNAEHALTRLLADY